MENSTVSNGVVSSNSRDVLTEILRQGAQKMLVDAIEVEVADYLARQAHLRDTQGKHLVVRNGYLPERTIQTGIGLVEVRQPRVRHRQFLWPQNPVEDF